MLTQLSQAVPRMPSVLLLQHVSNSLLCVPCTKFALWFCVKVCCIAKLFDIIDNIYLAAFVCLNIAEVDAWSVVQFCRASTCKLGVNVSCLI